MMSFPDEEEFYEFIKTIYSAESKIIGSKKQYQSILLKFSTPNEFLSDIDKNKEVIKDNLKTYSNNINTIIIFLSLKCSIKPNCDIQSIIINNAQKIIDFFKLVPINFQEAMNKKVIGSERRKQTFLIQIIKALIYLEKRNITEVTYEDLLKLRSSDFFKGRAKTESIPTLLQGVLSIIKSESLPRKLPSTTNDNKDYGTDLEDIKGIIQEYLNKKYINKGYQEDSPLSCIRCFFKWLHSEYSISEFGDISIEHWVKYKEYVCERNIRSRTKQVKIDLVAKFFEWAQIEGKVIKVIVQVNERYKGKVECKPRSFDNRDVYIKILRAIMSFEAKNRREYLAKQFLIVATATGLRANEILWLGPDCLIDEDGESGEVVLQVKEKLGFKNKTTSVLKWGIEPLKELNQRFKNIENKIKFYNSKTKEHFYSLFQDYDDTILSISFIRNTFTKIMRIGNVVDENGEPLELNQVKIHGFRHQKFNDIYCITNGSLTAVKIDSGHQTIKMAKTYIQQNEKERQLEALELIAQGKVVGKGADIINSLIKTPYSAQRYLEIVKKMNVNVLKEDIVDKKLRKFLGFGFCAGECCIKRVCERCDFFYTCNTYVNELKYRYVINFLLLMGSVVEGNYKTIVNSIDKELAIDLKYQEKWLIELGLTQSDIYELRESAIKEDFSSGDS